jgi:transcriptional regulator with XRE-family HTH domain
MTHVRYNIRIQKRGDDKMDMGQKIYNLRIQKGMTLEELGNKVGVGKSTVRKWENGIIANMKRDKISKVAEALDTTPAYLMGWQEETQEQTPMEKTDQDLLYKYHYIDDKGKHTVDTILEMEYNRCNSANLSKATTRRPEDDKSYLLPKAAHNDSITDLEELEKTKRDLDKLMKPEK